MGGGTPASDPHRRAVGVWLMQRQGRRVLQLAPRCEHSSAAQAVLIHLPLGQAVLRLGSRHGLAVQVEGCCGLPHFVAAL